MQIGNLCKRIFRMDGNVFHSLGFLRVTALLIIVKTGKARDFCNMIKARRGPPVGNMARPFVGHDSFIRHFLFTLLCPIKRCDAN